MNESTLITEGHLVIAIQSHKSWLNNAGGSRLHVAFKDLSNLDLTDFDLRHAIFSECNLEKCDFTDSDLRHTVFKNVNLSNADFTDCDLRNSYFSNSQLENVDFTFAKINTHDLHNVNTDGSMFNNTYLTPQDITLSSPIASLFGFTKTIYGTVEHDNKTMAINEWVSYYEDLLLRETALKVVKHYSLILTALKQMCD